MGRYLFCPSCHNVEPDDQLFRCPDGHLYCSACHMAFYLPRHWIVDVAEILLGARSNTSYWGCPECGREGTVMGRIDPPL